MDNFTQQTRSPVVVNYPNNILGTIMNHLTMAYNYIYLYNYNNYQNNKKLNIALS